ncbi:MAG: neutral/alkaline non-lysosomal ceramidase N-terminal domain-containing protein [Candidatus Bathyarchaeia archaeon]
MTALRSGRAVVNITPPIGLYLTGFGGRAGPAQGVHDELYAKAAVISDGRSDLAIVTMDLLGLDMDVVNAIYEGTESLGIPAKNTLLCASHTHSGPATITLRGLGDRDENYVKSIEKKIIGAINEAYANRQDSILKVGKSRCDISVNRRKMTKDGKIILGENPLGPIDQAVTTIMFESQNRKTILFNYACHPVVLGAANLLVSADYPGYAAATIERTIKGSVAMFIQGCCGNINSKIVGGTFEDAERLGNTLGKEAITALERSELEEFFTLKSSVRKLELPLQELPSEEEIEKERTECLKNLESAKQRNELGIIKLWQGLLEWADAAAELVRKGKRNLTQEIQLQVIRIGDVAIVAIPGEPFVEIALEIKARSKFKHTVVAGYSNGCIGYMPTPEAIEQGGYEVNSAYKFYDIAPLAPSAFNMIVDTAVQLCDEVYSIIIGNLPYSSRYIGDIFLRKELITRKGDYFLQGSLSIRTISFLVLDFLAI